MSRQRALLAICICFVFTVGAVSEAHETTYGNGYSWGRYANDQSPPYFALHPPVYYSYPVPRTYGYSPYAYPPGTRTPTTPSVQPQVIKNPFLLRAVSPENLESTGNRDPKGPIQIEKRHTLAGEGDSEKVTGRFDLKIVERFSLSPEK